MKTRTSRAAGFTLMELMVVVTIIGILAGFAIPQYLKTIENTRADDAVALMNMVATTNRMYAIDHTGTYMVGELMTSCGTTYGACTQGGTSPCELVACKYLSAQDFDKKTWQVYADNPAGNSAPCSTIAGGGNVACARRRAGVSPGTDLTPYTNWKYGVTTAGVISCDPICDGGSTAPPSPVSP